MGLGRGLIFWVCNVTVDGCVFIKQQPQKGIEGSLGEIYNKKTDLWIKGPPKL